MRKRIFITGISRGIGRSIAQSLSKREDYEIVGSCRNPESVSDKLEGVTYVKLDLTSSESISLCLSNIDRVDVLINNAGQSQIGSVEDVPMERIRSMFEVNLLGNIDLTKQIIPKMRRQNSGLIINIGSMTGTFPLPMYSSYCSSKAAFQMFSLCLRQELSQFGITVVHVEPNDIKTTITPELIYQEGGVYEKLARTVREEVRGKMSKAEDPVVVSKLIDTIISTKRPKPKYTVGGNGKFLVFVKRFVTDRFIENSTMRLYGLK